MQGLNARLDGILWRPRSSSVNMYAQPGFGSQSLHRLESVPNIEYFFFTKTKTTKIKPHH